jgi:hypothetical protein
LFARGFHILFATKVPPIRVVKSDPDDDKFIACAIALKAEVVVTGDRALRAVGQYQGIKIVTPEQFLRLYKFQYVVQRGVRKTQDHPFVFTRIKPGMSSRRTMG